MEMMATVLIIIQFVVYGSSITEKASGQLDFWPMLLGAVTAIAFVFWSKPLSAVFSNVQRMVYLVGVGGSLVFLGALGSFVVSQDAETVSEIAGRTWTIVVVIGVPSAICYLMHSYGSGAAEELAEQGFVAGLLPKGITDQEYRDSDFPEKDIIEPLRAKAVMAQPLVFLAVAGQVLEGLATCILIDTVPGLGEKHVVSQMVIDAGIWANELLGITHGLSLIHI